MPHLLPRRDAARALAAALAVAALSSPAVAGAWSGDGHRLVAAIAEERLTPAARRLVRDIVGDVPMSAAEVATWADGLGDRSTKPWHYVNLPPGAGFDAGRDCPRGDCVVGALERFTAVFRGGSSAVERADAFRWIVHLVADVHQPLHAGRAVDRGGNDLALRLGRRRQPTNLHRVWDADVVAAALAHRDVETAARALLAGLRPADAAAWAAELSPAAWATASSRAADALYAELTRYPRDGAFVLLPASYPAAQRDRAERALLQAGVRLAALLDRIATEREARAPVGAGAGARR